MPQMEMPQEEQRENSTETKLDLLFLLLVDERVWDTRKYTDPDNSYVLLREVFDRLGVRFSADEEVLRAFRFLSQYGDRNVIGRRVWSVLDELSERFRSLEIDFKGLANLPQRLAQIEENQQRVLVHQREQTESASRMSSTLLELSAQVTSSYSKMAETYSQLTMEQAKLTTSVTTMNESLANVSSEVASLKELR